MRLRVLLEPRYGATYDQILAMARATEEAGFDAFFRSDHYLGIDSADASYRPTDSWTTLAGLAVQTQRVRLGTLMTASTFRYPGPLAVIVATVDAMSGGRVELGIGAAWYEREHQSFGIPFPPIGERFDRLEEQLGILTGPMVDPARRALQPPRQALPDRGVCELPGPAADPGGRQCPRAPAHHHRWRWAQADPCPGRPVRRRVQQRIP